MQKEISDLTLINKDLGDLTQDDLDRLTDIMTLDQIMDLAAKMTGKFIKEENKDD